MPKRSRDEPSTGRSRSARRRTSAEGIAAALAEERRLFEANRAAQLAQAGSASRQALEQAGRRATSGSRARSGGRAARGGPSPAGRRTSSDRPAF